MLETLSEGLPPELLCDGDIRSHELPGHLNLVVFAEDREEASDKTLDRGELGVGEGFLAEKLAQKRVTLVSLIASYYSITLPKSRRVALELIWTLTC